MAATASLQQAAAGGAEQLTTLPEQANTYLASGSLRLFTLPLEVNLVIAEGRGAHIADVAGRDFIDFHLGSGPALLGHGHPAVTAAVSAQLPKGGTYSFLNQHVIRLARSHSIASRRPSQISSVRWTVERFPRPKGLPPTQPPPAGHAGSRSPRDGTMAPACRNGATT